MVSWSLNENFTFEHSDRVASHFNIRQQTISCSFTVRRFAGAIRFIDASFRSLIYNGILVTSDPQTVPLEVKLLLVDQN
jgi:translation initiation factor 2B subunit (eIF-2B alpha/beta/delta family)